MQTGTTAEFFDPYAEEPDFTLTEEEVAELEETADALYTDESVEEGEY